MIFPTISATEEADIIIIVGTIDTIGTIVTINTISTIGGDSRLPRAWMKKAGETDVSPAELFQGLFSIISQAPFVR